MIPIVILVTSNGILLLLAVIAAAPSICSSIPKVVASVSRAVQERAKVRLIIAAFMITIWISAHVVINLFCSDDDLNTSMSSASRLTSFGQNDNNSYFMSSQMSPQTSSSSSATLQVLFSSEGTCRLPSFLTHFTTIGMIAFTALTKIPYMVKTLVVACITVTQVTLNLLPLNKSFEYFDSRTYGFHLQVGHDVVLSCVLLTSLLVLFIINRQFELMSRRLFLWKKEVEEQKEKVGDMRKKNEALVYNILPPHVAAHFLGKKKKDEELYSKSYDCVGVLFAAMPNFSDFYTEESVNNQGLECLRFLNEVISDYDALLEQPRFKDIIKIKTIGSTYMIASGLNDTEVIPEDAPNTVKWAHLAQLTEFALALKETLNNINKESFNNFVLRIGLNQGPITAGVIGARKPHYDVWGNTVNVASRMESTGRAGSIQVCFSISMRTSLCQHVFVSHHSLKASTTSFLAISCDVLELLCVFESFMHACKCHVITECRRSSFMSFHLRSFHNFSRMFSFMFCRHFCFANETASSSSQVVQETKDLLQEFGYGFEQRGVVSVKGKGMLRTFYLVSTPNKK